MKVRTSIVAIAAAALGAFACASNPPAQEPTTTGANAPQTQENAPANENMQNEQNNGATPEQEQQPQQQQQQNTQQQGAPGTTGANGMTPQQANQYMFTTDGQIAGFMDAVDKAEVKQARLALQRAKDPQVKALAQYMLTQHGQMDRSQQHLLSAQHITAESTPASTQLESDSASNLTSLESKSGTDFDKAYIDLQVKEHQQVLGMLDNSMIPAAHNADFKQQLMNEKPKLEEHLRRAQALQQKLSSM